MELTPEQLETLDELVLEKKEKDKATKTQNLVDERDAKIRVETNKVTDTIMAEYKLLIDAIV